MNKEKEDICYGGLKGYGKTYCEMIRLQQQNKELHNKIDKAIQYMEHYIKVEERKYNDNVMKEFEYVIKLLKTNC